MSFTHNEYEHLTLLLDRYRSHHHLDRAARNALTLLACDVEEARLRSNKDNVINFEPAYVTSNDIPIKDIEETIMQYDIELGMNANDIILMLAEDDFIDPKDANHYYRALVAAQTALDRINQ